MTVSTPGGGASEQELAILQGAQEAWVSMDANGLVTGWNPAAEETFGWAAGEAIGNNLADLIIPAPLRAAHRAGLARYLDTRQGPLLNRRFETESFHRSGHEISIELTISDLEHDGTVTFHAFLHDITERKQISKHLETQREIAQLVISGAVPVALRVVPETVAAALGWEEWALWRVDPDGELRHSDALAPASRSGIGDAVRNRTVVVRDGEVAGGRPGTVLWLPIATEQRVVAVVELRSPRRRRVFDGCREILRATGQLVGEAIDRRLALERLSDLNDRNERILDGSAQGIVGLDGAGMITFLNRTALESLGAGDHVGRSIHEAVHRGPADTHPPDLCPLLAAVRGSGSLKLDDERFVCAGDRLRDIECVVSPLTGGGAGGAVLTFSDVTERRHQELQREADRAFLRTVLDNMSEGVFACDADGLLTLSNRASEEIRGRPSKPMGWEQWSSYYQLRDPRDGTPLAPQDAPLRRVLTGEVLRGAEVLIVRPDGDARLVSFSGRQMFGPDGTLIGGVVVMRDITDRRAAEDRGRASDRLMAAGERLGAFGSFEMDLVTQRIWWSPGMSSLLGLDHAETRPTAEAFVAALYPDDVAAAGERFQRIGVEGDRFHADFRIDRDDGTVGTLRAEGQVMLAEDGGGPVLRGMLQDVTERLRVDAALRHSELRARHTERMESLGQLAGGVAHDFNNLLAVILNYAAFVTEDLADRPQAAADVAEISRAAERAADLTRRLLLFSRREVASAEAVDVNELISGVLSLLRRTLGEQILVEVEVADELGPVLADRGQLEQLLVNLAVNARDAMPDGGRLRIVAREERLDHGADDLAPGRYVSLKVIDTGIGMDSATRMHVFEPFFTTKPRGRGTGLGLATAYGTVQEAGGSIDVASSPGEGAEFTIRLPVQQHPESDRPTVAAATSPSVPGTILVVEDEPSVRRVACRILVQAGFQALEACDASEALSVLEGCDGKVDLLVTDLVMPGISGLALHEQVTARWPAIPTLFMSGYSGDVVARDEIVERGLQILEKPFTGPGLIEAAISRLGLGTQPRPLP